MPLVRATAIFLSLASVALVGCGGKSVAQGAPGDASVPEPIVYDDAGHPIPDPPPFPPPLSIDAGCGSVTSHAAVPSQHRAIATTCTKSNNPAFPDASSTCATDADCADAGLYGERCFGGQCTIDVCYVDSDCPGTAVCACAGSFYGGNGIHGNECITAHCRVDSDCGSGGYCSPSIGYCGSYTGFDCHTHDDRCLNPTTDCAGCPGFNSCVFSPDVGYFVCSESTCSG